MSLPHDHDMQIQLLQILDEAPDGTMQSSEVYEALADRFPQLTPDDTSVPYRRSVSHWANRVQFARLHLLLRGFILPLHLSGRGFWSISPAGRAHIRQLVRHAEELLKELEATE